MDIDNIKTKLREKLSTKNYGIDDLLYNRLLDKIAYYVKALVDISNGLITEDYLIYELSKIDIIRIGDFNKELDSNLIYMGKPLIEVFNKAGRSKSLSTYVLRNNEFVSILVLFTPKEIFSMGNMVNLEGIDLNNDVELTKELYLALTKYLGTTLIKHQELNKLSFEGTEYQDGINVNNRVILNGITNKKEDYYEGFTTYEFNQKESRIIRHDYLSNLMNNYITDLVLTSNGESITKNDNIITKLSNKYKQDIFITKYLINSRKLLKEMERIKIDNLNLIHFIELNRESENYESKINNYLSIGEFIRPITKEQCLEFYSKYIK